MRALVIVGVFVFLALGGGVYYAFFYPPSVLKHRTQALLETMDKTVTSGDRAAIGEMLNGLFTDDASIRLSVSFFSLSMPDRAPAVQDFTKESFVKFIDNVLYSLAEYGQHQTLDEFTLAPDRKSAKIHFSGGQWADGKSYMGGLAVDMRFSGNSSCDATAWFEDKSVRFSEFTCEVHVTSGPKGGQADKFQNLDSLKDLIAK